VGASEVFDFESDDLDWSFELTHGESESMRVEDGSYGVSETLPGGAWEVSSVVCDDDDSMWDGATSVEINVDEGETVTCTFFNVENIPDEVLASILVTVDGVCVVDGDDASGRIDVAMSVDGGATVTITDSDGETVGTLSERRFGHSRRRRHLFLGRHCE
jgi:hypothetical protein